MRGHGATSATPRSVFQAFERLTVTIVRVGATKKYSEGWESAFGKSKKKAAPVAKKTAKKSTKKKAAPKKGRKK